MKLARTGLIAALSLLIAVPQAAAQQILRMPASGQKPSFSFTKDVVITPAPIPRLDLSPMFEVPIQDPTGILGIAEDAANQGLSGWLVGGLVLMGVGATIAYYEDQKEEAPDDTMMNAALGFVGAGLGVMVIGIFVDHHGPHARPGTIRRGITAGVRVPIGRR